MAAYELPPDPRLEPKWRWALMAGIILLVFGVLMAVYGYSIMPGPSPGCVTGPVGPGGPHCIGPQGQGEQSAITRADTLEIFGVLTAVGGGVVISGWAILGQALWDKACRQASSKAGKLPSTSHP